MASEQRFAENRLRIYSASRAGLDASAHQPGRVGITFTQTERYGLYSVRGEATKAELINACEAVCSKLETPHLIWDFSGGTIVELVREDFIEIAHAAKRSIPPGSHRRTAYVGPSEVVFAMLCMYSAIAVMEEIPGEFSAFRTMAEAEDWLNSAAQS